MLLLFVLRLDFDSTVVESFWESANNIDVNDPTKMLICFFEKYPLLFKIGPILEMAIMAYNQILLGKPNRGLIFDCYHMIYAPYMDHIVTGDEGFVKLKSIENRYRGKLIHIKDLDFKISPFIR